MTDYVYKADIALDPNNPGNVASNSVITLYAEDDTANTAPLTVTDMNGLPITLLETNPQGILPAFIAQVPIVRWVGGGLSGVFSSPRGLLDQATAASSAAATAAAAAAQAKADADAAAALALGPTQEQVQAAVNAAAKPSNIGVDTDGVYFFSAGANAVALLADTDGTPYVSSL